MAHSFALVSRLIVIFGAASLSACRPTPPDPRFVAEWLRMSQAVVRAERLATQTAVRLSAYGSIALYEGYAADSRTNLLSLAGRLNGLWSVPGVEASLPVDGATVAAEAERVVLDSLFRRARAGTQRVVDSLADTQIEARRRDGVGDALRQRSVTHGRALAGAILAWAAADRLLDVASSPSKLPSSDSPSWGAGRTFALRNGDECAPPAPPPYSVRRGSDFWRMGKELNDSASALTSEKRAMALFWADDSASTGSSWVHWMSAVNQLIAMRRLTADQAAEAYALTSVAIADAFTGSWKAKSRSSVGRPLTYMRRAFDGSWTPIVATPQSPEYPSEHAVLSAAAAEVLITLLGDSAAFADSTQVDRGVPARTFRGFSQARDEAALAGVYGGTQFMPATLHGIEQGRCIGQRVRSRLPTRPVQL